MTIRSARPGAYALAALLLSGCWVSIGSDGADAGFIDITQQPQAVTVQVGSRAAFAVGALATSRLSYQWRRNGVDLPGANGPSHLTPPVTLADSGSVFSVKLCNAFRCRDSDGAVLTVVR